MRHTRARPGLDAEHRALLHEELQSPCYDEIAFFVAFSKIVVRAKRELVVVDTAPTGHTLRLLDTAGSYHRQLVPHEPKPGQPRFVTPLMILRDPMSRRCSSSRSRRPHQSSRRRPFRRTCDGQASNRSRG